MYVLIAFLMPFFHALSCIVDSYLSNDIFKKVPTLVFYASISNSLVIPFLFLFGMPEIPSFEILTVLFVISLIEVFYLAPYFLALQYIDTSIVVALFALGQVTLPILAYFIVGEQLGFLQYLGFGIILLSSFLLNFDVKKFKLNVAFILMLIVSVLLSLSSVLSKYSLQQVDFVTVLFWIAVFSSLINFSFLLFKKYRTDIVQTFPYYAKKFKIFILNEALYQIGTLALTAALAHLPVLVTESISSSQSIFTLLLEFVIYKVCGKRFKEQLSRSDIIKKFISFAAIIIGIYIVLK